MENVLGVLKVVQPDDLQSGIGTVTLSFYDASPFVLGTKIPKLFEFNITSQLPAIGFAQYALVYRHKTLYLKVTGYFVDHNRYYKVGVDSGQLELVLDVTGRTATMGYGTRPGGSIKEYVVLTSYYEDEDPPVPLFEAFVSVDGTNFTADPSYPVDRFTEVAISGDRLVSGGLVRADLDADVYEPIGLVTGTLGVAYNRDLYSANYGGHEFS
jgi:hypothetical protein